MAHVSSMNANYGGTEIYNPLSTIYRVKPKGELQKQVIVLTDGEVSNSKQTFPCHMAKETRLQVGNTDAVIKLVGNSRASGIRTFAIGLGSDASHHLVNGLAQAGTGTAKFAALNERLETKVQQTLENALQPSMTGLDTFVVLFIMQCCSNSYIVFQMCRSLGKTQTAKYCLKRRARSRSQLKGR